MSKKQIRLILACTVFLPVWLFIGFAVLIFPGCITFFLAPLEAARLGLKLLLQDGLTDIDREEIKSDLQFCLPMMFAPIVMMVSAANKFVESGSLELD